MSIIYKQKELFMLKSSFIFLTLNLLVTVTFVKSFNSTFRVKNFLLTCVEWVTL